MSNEIWTANQAQGWAGNPSQFGVAAGVVTNNPDSPNTIDPLYWTMSQWWEPVRAATEGTQYLRQNARRYLPQQPLELKEAWEGRVARSVFSPYFSRVVRTAIGLILRKRIILEGGDEAYWEEWRVDCDRQGTDLEEFAREQLATSISFGHSAFMVDFPKADGVVTLLDQNAAQLKPYFITVKPWDILGWRSDVRANAGELQQVRIKEYVARPDGAYGLKYSELVRVLLPGAYELWENLEGPGWTMVDSGSTSIKQAPLAVTYAGKLGTLFSKPPLLDIAHLNLTHYQRRADLIHALHIAAQPLLVMAGWDDQASPVGLSVNNAIITGPRAECEVYFVEPSSSAFESQREELDALAEEISSLGIATLLRQKNTAESGLSKNLDRVDSNSMLALISKDLEATLQQAVNWAAEFAGVQAPTVVIDRDFDTTPMEGTEMTAINTLFTSGLIDQRTALTLLQKGEVLGDEANIDEILEFAEQEQLATMEHELSVAEGQAKVAQQFAPNPAAPKG